MATLHRWQRDALERLSGWTGDPFLVSACPGAGKTRPAIALAVDLIGRGEIDRVIVLCPTVPLTRQWATAGAAGGLQLAPDTDGVEQPRGFHGVAVTYARVASAPRRIKRGVGTRTLVIADEAHHLGEELVWGAAFDTAFAGTSRKLLLSGTPFRSDGTPIPGIRYDRDGLAMPDVSYTYAEAVADGICRPVAFVTFDGTLSWRSGEDVVESSFETILDPREASRRYRTAISTELPEGLPRILREADRKLGIVRGEGHRDAGGLVVAADSEHARRIAWLLHEITGRRPVVVVHTERRASQKLSSFTSSRDPWIVAVNMVSEGVDIPRLRVGVYATAAKTPLVFRQIVGRFVRTLPGMPLAPSWVYLPADPILRDHASRIEGEVARALRDPTHEQEGELEKVEDRVRTESSETPHFEPLSAEFASQMTLFGPPSPPPVRQSPSTPPDTDHRPTEASRASDDPTAGPVDGPAAFERRARLRDQRQRLVAELHRRGGRSHREINSQINTRVGVARVQEASIEQLQRSIDLLLKELARSSRSRRGVLS